MPIAQALALQRTAFTVAVAVAVALIALAGFVIPIFQHSSTTVRTVGDCCCDIHQPHSGNALRTCVSTVWRTVHMLRQKREIISKI